MSVKNHQQYLAYIGRRIKHLRKERNMSQRELSIILDSYPNSVYRLEAGKTNPTIKSLLSICDVFKVSLDQLLEEKYPLND